MIFLEKNKSTFKKQNWMLTCRINYLVTITFYKDKY